MSKDQRRNFRIFELSHVNSVHYDSVISKDGGLCINSLQLIARYISCLFDIKFIMVTSTFLLVFYFHIMEDTPRLILLVSM